MPSSPPSLFTVPRSTILDSGKHFLTLLGKLIGGSDSDGPKKAELTAERQRQRQQQVDPQQHQQQQPPQPTLPAAAVEPVSTEVERDEAATTDKAAEEQQQPQITEEIDIGLLGNEDELGDCTLEEALQLTAALVGHSVSPLLMQPERSRILVLGSGASWRASFLAEATFTNRPVVALNEMLSQSASEETLRKSMPLNAVLWCDSTDPCFVLSRCPSALFDAVLLFNAPTAPADTATMLARAIARVLKPGGCFAGTGLFRTVVGLINSQISNTQGHQPQRPDRITLRAFRNTVEDLGLYVHVAMDMSLEGRLVLRVTQPDDDPLEGLRRGELICGRFLATVPSQLDVAARPDRFLSVTGCADPCLLSSLPSPCAAAVAPSLPSRLPTVIERQEEEEGEAVVGREQETQQLAAAPQQQQQQQPRTDGVVVTGVSLGLPNAEHPERSVFDSRNIPSLFAGENFLSDLTAEDKQRMLDMNIVQVMKKDGKRIEKRLSNEKEVIQVAAKIAHFDLAKEYGIPPVIVEAMDTTYQLAVAAGLEALRDAGIILSDSHGPSPHNRPPKPFSLPQSMQDETGVIFASSFPALDSLVEEVTACSKEKARRELLAELKAIASAPSSSVEIPEGEPAPQSKAEEEEAKYRYNRKLLFRLLVMAHSQLAELINARGPNTQVNAACAGTTQAIAIAEDWIRTGRCRRVVVVSADNPTNENLFPYIGTGFLALTAASTLPGWQNAAAPFDKRRRGMILGAGAVGLVLESTQAAVERSAPIRAELIASSIKNSALHASLMDQEHICAELAAFIARLESELGIPREALAKDLLYYSHETFTGVCAKIEAAALRAAFGDAASEVLIANTKGFTGHPMAVGIEDVMAVASLATGLVPPIANLREPDPALGPLLLSKGGKHDRNYVLRFAAGFGSQFVLLMFRKWKEQSKHE